jgi:hypothetical protein
MSRFLGVAAIAAVTTVTAVIGYIAYRVKTGKSTVTVTVKNTDTATEANVAADTVETADPLVDALRELAEQEAWEYVEYLRATKPRLFIEVDVEYSGGYVWLSKAGRTIQLANLINTTSITEALEELQEETEE